MPLIVFVSAFLTLALEVFYTRLFSALFWRNAAFAILSLAMLGIGASGVLVYLAPRWFPERRVKGQLPWLLLSFGASIAVSYFWVLSLSAARYDAMQPLESYVALVGAGLLPFFFGGLVLSVVFTHAADRIASLYRIDLVGASLGAVLVLPALRALNGPMLVPVLAGLPAAIAAIVAHRSSERAARGAALVTTVAACALGWAQASAGVLNVTHSHGVKEERVTLERWDPLARVTVHDFGPLHKWLDIDAQVQTAILRYDGDPEDVEYLQHNVLQLAYRLRQYPKVLIIGPGGGSDVLSAVTSGNQDVTGVEVNRSTIALMHGELRAYTGGLYDMPQVKIRIADGRAYVAAMKERVDLIQATFVDTFTSSASGGHALSENYLYTVDGFQDFLDHLTDEGVLSMSRWGGEAFSFAETHRAVGLAIRALEERGVADPGRNIVVVQGAPPEHLARGGGYQNPNNFAESMSTLLVKRVPFRGEELDRLEQAITSSGFRPVWMGERGGRDETVRVLLDRAARPVLYADYRQRTGLDISAVTDDRPFFFDMIDPLRSLAEPERREWTKNSYYFARALDIHMLHQLLSAVALASFVLLVLPLLFRFRALRAVPSIGPILFYFVCLGVGFIGIELAMMQRFSLFLEHPVHSLVVFLSSILLFSGLGSASTGRISEKWSSQAARRAGLLVAVLVLYGVLLPRVTHALIGLPLPVKMGVAAAFAFPPAFLMGMLFPLGVTVVKHRNADLVPWVWGLNSAFSVVGAVVSLCLAMSFGYAVTWFVFVGAYALAALSMLRVKA